MIHMSYPLKDKYVESWQSLIQAQNCGLVRSIGVCNFLPEHIERLEKETRVKPSINQIELHPFFNQADQRKWHAENNIQTESWSPIARANKVFYNETIQKIAAQHDKTPSQVILRWHHQLRSIPIPKSASKERQIENISIIEFTLDEAEMNAINTLNRTDGRQKDQDLAVYEEY